MPTIRFTFSPNGTPTDVTSVVLRDVTNTFGVRRTDTNGVLVASGTVLTHISTGVYNYTFSEPAAGLSYEYALEWVYLGNTNRTQQILQTASQGTAGNVPIAQAGYVTMGVSMVSCGDMDLEEFLNTHAATLWAMESRLGVAMDLWYQRFVLALVGLALDHVRMLIDTEIQNQQARGVGYSNSTSTNAGSSASLRQRQSLTTQSSSSSQYSVRSSVRFSTTQMVAVSGQSMTRAGSGEDNSEQEQAVINRRTASNDQIVKTSVMPSGTFTASVTPVTVNDSRQYRNSHTQSESKMLVEDGVKRYNVTVPFIGSLSGLNGTIVSALPNQSKKIDPLISKSSMNITTSDKSYLNTQQRRKVSTTNTDGGTTGVSLSDMYTNGFGRRDNDNHRSSQTQMVSSASQSARGSMTGANNAESHNLSQSLAHAESTGHAESNSSALAHRESAGASQMQSSSLLNRQYYDQIFQSLQQMWKDTVEQVKQLEGMVLMESRYLLTKLPVRTPQAGLVRTVAAVTPIRQSPARGLIDTQLNPYRWGN